MEDSGNFNSVAFVDNPHAPDFYADCATGFHLLNGNLKVTLVATRVNHVSSPGPVSNVVIGRLVMSVAAAEGLANGLLHFLKLQDHSSTPITQGTSTLQ